MADLVVPPLGESITEAVVGRWMKQVGDAVASGDPVLELETDKATMELPSPISGTIGEQLVSPGQSVKVGEVVARIAQGAAATAPAKASKPKANDEEASVGGKAGTQQPAALDKAGVPAGDVAGEEPAGPAEAAAPKPATAPAPGPTPAAEPHGSGNGTARRMSPSMRRAQREHSGPPQPPQSSAPPPVPQQARAPQPSAPQPSAPRPAGEREEVVRMSTVRKRIAERLVEAQHTAAALTTFNEVDMSAVMALRESFKQDFVDRHGVKLGFMSFFVKAAVAALRRYPGLNAEIRGDDIVYKKRYDLGIAVSTERGLIVPVLRECDALDFAGVEKGINELAGKARASKLQLSDLTNGTFTITNGGIYGSMMSTPLLNHPQTGILGMHNIVERAVVIGGKIEVRPMMYVALTYDHRVVDGKEAVSFLVAVKERIERPDRLLLGV